MFFILSKTLSYLTMPLVVVVILFGLSFILKKKRVRKWARIVSFSLLLFFSNEFIANEVMSMWEMKAIPYASIKKTYDLGIVLTGVTLNDRLPDDRVYFSHGADRVTHTVDLYKRGVIKAILISGGSGRLVTEARQEAGEIRKAMIMMGVPDSVLTLEGESRNTHESAVYVSGMLSDKSQDLLLITSSFHMRRSLACFRHEGIIAEPFPTDFYSHPRYFTLDVLLVPKVGALEIWNCLIKEWIGLLAYRIAGYI